MLLDQVRCPPYDPGIEQRLPILVVKCRDGNAPRPLTRDAPIGPRFHRSLDPSLAPIGHPIDSIDCGQRLLAKSGMIDLDEPLVHRPKNDRRLAPPAMRIAV